MPEDNNQPDNKPHEISKNALIAVTTIVFIIVGIVIGILIRGYIM